MPKTIADQAAAANLWSELFLALLPFVLCISRWG